LGFKNFPSPQSLLEVSDSALPTEALALPDDPPVSFGLSSDQSAVSSDLQEESLDESASSDDNGIPASSTELDIEDSSNKPTSKESSIVPVFIASPPTSLIFKSVVASNIKNGNTKNFSCGNEEFFFIVLPRLFVARPHDSKDFSKCKHKRFILHFYRVIVVFFTTIQPVKNKLKYVIM
jgi:hypothetical protein